MRSYLFLFLVLFTACEKKDPGKCPVRCYTHGSIAFFSGYAADEVDSVYLKDYKLDGSFTSVLRTTLYTNPPQVSYGGPSITGLGDIPLSPTLDYEIFVPATGQTFRIAMKDTLIVYNYPCDSKPKGPCHEPFAGATVTGGNHSMYSTGPDSHYIILKK